MDKFKNQRFSSKDFYDIREIGAGSYGKVKLVELHDNLYAVKQVSQELIRRYEKVANVYFERDVMQAANSLSIPQFYFAFRVSQLNLSQIQNWDPVHNLKQNMTFHFRRTRQSYTL